jgi:tRNA/tmRNA/rRNA uracil-C5-methylase (TrmA/RlmC/RlmD family)
MTEHARGGLDATELGCPHVERCPGCPLGTLPYAVGLVHKGERLEQALRRHPELDTVKPCGGVLGAASARSYRLRAKLVANAAGQLGLFAAGSHDVVDIPDCRVQAPELLAAAAALRALAPLEIALRGVDLRL